MQTEELNGVRCSREWKIRQPTGKRCLQRLERAALRSTPWPWPLFAEGFS